MQRPNTRRALKGVETLLSMNGYFSIFAHNGYPTIKPLLLDPPNQNTDKGIVEARFVFVPCELARQAK